MPDSFATRIVGTLAQKWSDSKGKIIVTVILVGAGIYLWNDYRDAIKTMQHQASIISTQAEEFKKLTKGNAYQGSGTVVSTDKQAIAEAVKAQGEETVRIMREREARLMAMFEAQGRVLEELRRGQPQGPVVINQDGGFTGVRLAQVRTGPALSDVTLFYDPKNPDPSKRLYGDWRSYQETFSSSVGEWQKEDGGVVGTFRLTREVSVDGKVVGKEEVPLTNARTVVNRRAFENMGITVPRFTLSAGAAWDWQKRSWGPALLADYRVTDHWGVGGGFAGNQGVFLVSLRMGGK